MSKGDPTGVLEAVERHLVAGSGLIHDVCLLPADGPDPLDGCTVVVAPETAELSNQKVPMARRRMREAIYGSSPTAPHTIRIAELIVLDPPLARTAEGALARDEIAEQARATPVDEEIDHPVARRLLERLEDVLEVPGPFTSSMRFEVDLGLDSLDLLQIRLLLYTEFGVTLADDELWTVKSVGDALRRAVEAADDRVAELQETPVTDYTWAARLREAPEVPLNTRFNMDRRGGWHLSADLTLRGMSVASKLMYGMQLLYPERLPSGPFLLCPTHQSLIDSPLIYAAFPREVIHRSLFLAYGPYFRTGPLSWMIRRGRIVLTGEGDNVTESLQLAWEGLQRGWAIVIFPEGNCSSSGAIMNARPGVGMLSCEAQVPVVPVLYQGSGGTYSPRNPGFHLPKMRIVVGEPIQPPAKKAFGRADYRAMADRWREAVLALEASHDLSP